MKRAPLVLATNNRTANLVSGSDPGTLIRRQTNKTERRRGAKGHRAEHKGELLKRQTG